MELSELAQLVRRAQGGDSAAFDALHARFAPSVHAVLLARLRAADADDALQDTFVLAWKRLAALRDADAIGPWLHAIARHAATDRCREPRGAGEAPVELPARAEDPGAERDELRERVMEHLRSLPDAYKETLAMRLVEGLTGPEIAAATGLTAGSVRVNLCRGMALLRELLEKEGWP
jgi:RNA polymerase sigma-70 factor, ECF subfamily